VKPLQAPDYSSLLAAEVGLTARSVAAVLKLLEEGATVPFIARYRKEATNGADDASIQTMLERWQFHKELFERKVAILASIDAQGKLTDELRASIERAAARTELEDIYLPYRPRRRTRATMAREKGLEPLALRMLGQADRSGSVEAIARAFVDPAQGVASVDDALQGARDIVAETIVETASWRTLVRDLTCKQGHVLAKAARGKKGEKSKFSDYYDYAEAVSRIPPHRVLAILRGEKEGFLSVKIRPDEERAKATLARRVVGQSIWRSQMRSAVDDAYDRLLASQVETEIRADLKSSGDRGAIDVFASNLRELLMAAPFGSRPLIAVDPGFRTGCKVVVLSATGQLLDHGVVYPTEPRRDVDGAKRAFDRWFDSHPEIAAIAVGNGTGGRETFSVVRDFVKERSSPVSPVMVNESGASVYSASELAREEFPDHDVTVRGAVSIGRRLQDPLAELVKIDPKSIGVGQYQHDVDQKKLKTRLDDVVESCVNSVGVDLNTASAALLHYVSGLGPKIAKAIVRYRDAEGRFASRAQLKKVPGLGAKTYELAAGFLKVDGKNPLDASSVHPERYGLVTTLARDLGRSVADLIGDEQAVQSIDKSRYLGGTVGRFTLDDILEELAKPGRDPRDRFEAIAFRDDVNEVSDLKEGMTLSGVVTNVTHFGAFVDVGVHQDGLVHVSQIADRYVKDPAEELSVGQSVKVRVLEVDLDRRRIALSIKQA